MWPSTSSYRPSTSACQEKNSPSNHLEALNDDPEGQHSIRINLQYRVCFVWTDDEPRNVEIVDYHELRTRLTGHLIWHVSSPCQRIANRLLSNCVVKKQFRPLSGRSTARRMPQSR